MTGVLIVVGITIAFYFLVMGIVGETGAWAAGRQPPDGWSRRDARRKYRRAFYYGDPWWRP